MIAFSVASEMEAKGETLVLQSQYFKLKFKKNLNALSLPWKVNVTYTLVRVGFEDPQLETFR